jgi:hypothetical protein
LRGAESAFRREGRRPRRLLSEQLAEIVEAVEHDPRWGWLAVHSGLLKPLTGSSPMDDGVRVDQWLRLRGLRVNSAGSDHFG